MKVSIVTLFPDLYQPFLSTSLIGRAVKQERLEFDITSLLSFCSPKERIDAPTVGHGPGMLLRPEVVEKAIQAQEQKFGRAFRVFFSPHGEQLTQPLLGEIAEQIRASGDHCMVLPARYEGMDVRLEEEYADVILSIGDYVLMGGDLPAMVFLEAISRLIPGVIGSKESVEEESFSGPFVDHPHYTAPLEWHGKVVPDVLRSGNHAAQAVWRRQQSIRRTLMGGHFQWLRSQSLTAQDRKDIHAQMPHHYAVLMHTDVVVEDGRVGESSVTSLDIHDIARSAKTFGLHGYFIATRLVDQKRIVEQLLGFWQQGEGVTYNPSRHEALAFAEVVDSLDVAIAAILEREGVEPIIIGTSARELDNVPTISYAMQHLIWRQERPVLFVFGTARGLAESVLMRCDYLVPPVYGISGFNHLSVRSAAAIVFDRWMGL
ncbi:MAG: tRNA (guanine-N(1)-)-methyltransferase [candidate division TM6 bacterium GW2011_GWF2_43_17]|nr:MAG: tRNA (guanine-N(1)-)-methyltransferase [candidate division TM6 bacterium GW2011_GWF2_43_17]HAU30162.1 hypothetical protein [Candidatus Dependentiae bacterium]